MLNVRCCRHSTFNIEHSTFSRCGGGRRGRGGADGIDLRGAPRRSRPSVPSRQILRFAQDELETSHVILATGGRSIPKTGSDGFGYELARSLGHTIAPAFPALVPLVLPRDHELTALSGTSVDAELA